MPNALITGGSSGIGLELAKQLAQQGHDILIAADDRAELNAAREQIQAGRVEICACDLATRAGVETLYAAAKAFGPIDILCCNAGVGVYGKFQETALDDELRMIALNDVSVVHLVKLCLPEMLLRKSGKILITSSIAGAAPDPFLVVYAATKAFLLHFAEGLRHDVKDSGVTVTALMPGPTDTEFFQRADMMDAKVVQDGKLDDPADVAKDAIEALMAGKDHVVAGSLKNKMQVGMSRVSPMPVNTAMSGKQTGPAKGH